MEFYETIKETKSFLNYSNYEVSNYGNVRRKGENKKIERMYFSGGGMCYSDGEFGKAVFINGIEIQWQIDELNGIYHLYHRMNILKIRNHHTKLTIHKHWNKNSGIMKGLNLSFKLKELKLPNIQMQQTMTTYHKKDFKKLKIPYGMKTVDKSNNPLNVSNYDVIHEEIKNINRHRMDDSDSYGDSGYNDN